MSAEKFTRGQLVEIVGPDYTGNSLFFGHEATILTHEPDSDGDWTVSLGKVDATFPAQSLKAVNA